MGGVLRWNAGLGGYRRDERGWLGVGDCVSIADIASAVSLVLVGCKSREVSGFHDGMGVALIRDEGLPPLYICVDKVFAGVSHYFGSVIICKLAARSGSLSRLPSPPTVSVRHGTARTTAISPGAFHPALLSQLGNEQVQVSLRDRTHSACHHQQPSDPNHDLHPPSPAPVGSILPSPLLLRLH